MPPLDRRPDGPAPDHRQATQEWSESLSRQIVEEIKRRRGALGLRAQDVSDRAAELGIHMPRGVIARLESGDRKQLSVAELLTFALALDVPPILLIAPIDSDQTAQQVEVRPGYHLGPDDLFNWFTTGFASPALAPDWAIRETERRWFVEMMRHTDALSMRRQHEQSAQLLMTRLGRLQQARREESRIRGGEQAEILRSEIGRLEEELDVRFKHLCEVRERMQEKGFTLPYWDPALEARAALPESGRSPWGIDAAIME